jgi:hypothetical protein
MRARAPIVEEMQAGYLLKDRCFARPWSGWPGGVDPSSGSFLHLALS